MEGPQIKTIICGMANHKCSASAAHTYKNNSVPSSAKEQHEITT